MPISSELLFRRVWLTNGILLLVLLLGTLGMAGYGLLNSLWNTDEHGVRPTSKKGAPDSSELRPRAIRYDEPDAILNTDWMLLQVRYGTDYGRHGTLASGLYERSYSAGGPLVNVVFLPPRGGQGRLLLDRPAYIRQLEFPREHPRYPVERIDSVPWITYAIVFEDTDGSGRLDEDDAAELYMSDLDGSRFRRVLPPGLQVHSTELLPDRRLLVTALEARGGRNTPGDQLPLRAFRYDPRTGQVTSDAVLDSLAAKAGRILGRP
jgi:hypothetical protein